MASLGQVVLKRLGQYIAGRNPTPRPRPFAEMGTAGTAVWGGYVQVKERSPEWVGRQKYITITDLAVNGSIVAASVHYFLNLVAYPKWTFRATDEDDEEALALAEFADNAVNDMDTPWYKVVRRAAMYRFHGFGIQEWTAKHRDDGLIGFKDIEARPQQTIEQWDVDVDGTILGAWQRSPQTGNMLGIPRDKMLYLVEDTLTDSPEGIGMFRHMADPYKRLKQMQALEIRAFERDLRGTPIARAPLTMMDRAVSQGVITQDEADRMVADFQSLVKIQVKQSDTGIVLDSLPYFSDSDAGDQVSAVNQWGFELLNGGGVGHAEVAAAIDRIQREIARIVGTEHMMMGDIGGNRALSEDKSRNLYLIANSVLKYIGSQVKNDILVPLWKLNGFPMRKMPEPKPEDVTFKNVDAITAAIQKMAAAGAVLSPSDPVINDVRDILGISRVPDDVMAQGAAAPQNPMLAGVPPQLQLGGKGGQPVQLGGGGPGKQPGMGGGGLPGTGGFDPTKKFIKETSHARRRLKERLNGQSSAGDLTALGQDRVDPAQTAGPGDQLPGANDPQPFQTEDQNTNATAATDRRPADQPQAQGAKQPTLRARDLGTPGNLKPSERPQEDPANPGYIDIKEEQRRVADTVDEPPQIQQLAGNLGTAHPADPKAKPNAGAADDTKPDTGAGAQTETNIGGIPVEPKGNGKVEVDAKFLADFVSHLSPKPADQSQPMGSDSKAPAPTSADQAGAKGPKAAPPAGKPGEIKPAQTGGDAQAHQPVLPGTEPAAPAGKPKVGPGLGKPPGDSLAAAAPAKLPQATHAKPVATAQPGVPAAAGQAPQRKAPQGAKAPGPAQAQASTAGGIPGAQGAGGMPAGMGGAAGANQRHAPAGAVQAPGMVAVGPAQAAQPPQPIDPKTGQPLPLAAVDPKTGKPKPTAMDPVTGKPVHGAVDPMTGLPAQPLGTPPPVPQEPEKPEMTPDRASEILQPYADYGRPPEEEAPRTEGDVLWSRLGEEKDVQPNTSDVDPETGLPIDPETGQPIDPNAEGQDNAQLADMPPDLAAEGDPNDPEGEAAVRARLRGMLDSGGDNNTVVVPDSVNPEDAALGIDQQMNPRTKPRPKNLKPKTPRVRL